ncbi:MAG: MFS transporter, partial [Alphaproteobacteria bacterium]
MNANTARLEELKASAKDQAAQIDALKKALDEAQSKARAAAASGGGGVSPYGEPAPDPAGKLGLGRDALPEEVAAWDGDVFPDGRGLPEGSGDVATGEELFLDRCATCHGDFGEGSGRWPVLAGGLDSLTDEDPVKTVGSYWPYLSTAYDYIHRSMPFGAAQTLSDDEAYAILAYILYSNDLVDEDFVLSKDNFLSVAMPNADGFIVDDRPETEYKKWRTEPCMTNCKDEVHITMHARVLDVTPDDGTGGDHASAAPAGGETQMASATETPAAAPASAPAIDPELAKKGEKVFKKCKACH